MHAEVASGAFRQDLFYRLNVVPLRIPPLRERIEDIDVLVPYFIARFNKRLGRQIVDVTPAVLDALRAYQWPGNIRELENVIERSILLSDEDVLDVDDLPQNVQDAGGSAGASTTGPLPGQGPPPGGSWSLKDVVKEHTRRVERHVIHQTLSETGGNVTKAAELLQISRKSLQMKMKEYGLRTPRSETGGESSKD